MNFSRLFCMISILLLLVSSGCSSKKTTVAGEPVVQKAVPKVEVKDIKPETIPLAPLKEKQDIAPIPEVVKKEEAPLNNVIGCLLPLSGRYAEYGSKSLDAILLAAGIFNPQKKVPWKIVIRDSGGIPENTRAAVADLAEKEKVIAIVAVAGATDAADAAQEAELRKVPLILIAAREGLTATTNYVFQHFLTATQQARALVKYALNDMNCGIHAILYPKDDYGQEMVKVFRMEADKIGGKVERAISYGKNQTDFTEEINKVSGYAISAAKAAAAGKTESKTKIAVDFEALFIPDSDVRVKMIASQLAFYDVKGIHLLGTSLWNSPDLLKKNVEPLEGAVFVDSFFTGSFYPETNDFMDIYYTSYRREPENIEALAYDTAGIVISVLEDYRIGTREQFAEALRKVENYQGVTGRVSFGEDGVAQKTPFIIKVINGKLRQVK